MYKQAIILDLRFQTPKGVLLPQQLFHLTLSDLATSIKLAKDTIKKDELDNDLSFLNETTAVDSKDQLRFNILKDVYLTKKAEAEAAQTALEIKAHNQKIDALIAKKREGQLEALEIADLEKLRK